MESALPRNRSAMLLNVLARAGKRVRCASAGRTVEGLDLGAIPVDSTDSLHLQIEAVKLAFADLYEYVSDADTMRVKNADLLDTEYLRTRSRLIDLKKEQTPQYGVPASGTRCRQRCAQMRRGLSCFHSKGSGADCQVGSSHYPVCPKRAITLSRKDWHSSANRAVV